MKRALSLGLWMVVLLLAGYPPRLYAQRFTFQNLAVDDGLIQSQAICMAQDSTGYLWIGTLGGLSRYDGHNFVNYNIRNGLPGNMVQAVAAAPDGNIWVGTRKGLASFNGRTFTQFPIPVSEPSGLNTSQQLTVWHDTVWWRAGGMVYAIAKGKVQNAPIAGLPGRVTAMLLEDSARWFAIGDTLWVLRHGNMERHPVLSGVPISNLYIHTLTRLRNGQLLLGTSYGLYRFDGHVATPLPLAGQPWLWFSARDIAEDRNGTLWVATGNGVAKIDSNITWLNRRNGLSDNAFLRILEDREGNLWMASDGQGIFRFSGTLFTVVDEAMGLPSAQVMAIASRRDSLYIGTWEAGLFVFKDGKITPRPLPAPQVPAITSLLHTSDGRLWIGTRENGLFVLSRGIFKSFTAPHRGLASNAVYAIYETPALRLFVGLGNGAAEVRNDSFFTLPQLNERVVSLRQIGDDSLLLATEKAGLFLWHNSTMNRWLTHTLADSSLVNCMVTMGNDLWLGSSDNGILKWNKATGKLMVINKRDGLRSDFIYNITDDGRGNIWAGTGYGIHKITLHNDTPVVHFYGRDAGVTGTESNINAVLRQPDGGIWFGTTKGAIHYEPHAHAVEARPLAIVLQSVKIIGEASIDSTWYDSSDNWYGVPYQLRLPYRKNNVAFSFAAISLSGAGQLLYRYRLEGLDAPWSEWGPTTSVTFSALPPGKYVFVVQCTGAASLHTPELRYAFEIATPFHKTWWFYLGVLLACLLLGILLQAAYSRQRQRRNKLRMRLRAEEQSKIRLRTAEDFHDEVGNKLTRINVLTNILKSKTAGNEEAERLLNQIQDNTAQLYSGTRDILWSLKPTNDNLYEILFRINDFAGELFQDTSVQFTFTGIQEDWRKYRMPMDVNRNLTMIFKEALNNILKYADASEVSLVCSMKGRNVCVLTLSDDGRGFDTRQPREGNGLHNMMVRAGRINGRLYVDSRPGKGTILTLSFRIPRNLH